MVKIGQKVISPADAVEARDASLTDLANLLRDAGEGVREIAGAEVGKDDARNRRELEKIADLLEGLRKDIDGVSAGPLDAQEIEARTQAIYTLFDRLDGDARSLASVLEAQTNAVLAHASARRMGDAAAIVKEPRKALSLNTVPDWSFLGEYQRIAAEIKTRMPVLFGGRVDAEGRHTEIVVTLRGSRPPRDANRASPILELKKRVEDLLAWELRKTGYAMRYEVVTIDDPPDGTLVFEVKVDQ